MQPDLVGEVVEYARKRKLAIEFSLLPGNGEAGELWAACLWRPGDPLGPSHTAVGGSPLAAAKKLIADLAGVD